MNGSQKDFAYAGESQQNRLEQAQKSERNMLFAFFLFIVGVLVLIGFGFIVRKSKELDPFYCVMPPFLAALLFFGSGVKITSLKDQLLTGLAIPEKNLYLVGTTTNVVCLIPARLNGLTAIVEPDGSPRYYGAVEMEANQGPVIAVKAKDGEIVLKPFPLKEGVEK